MNGQGNKIVAVLKLANLDSTGSRKFDDQELSLIAKFISEDYPDLLFLELEEAIQNGIKGKYSTDRYFPLNCEKIYSWIKKYIQEKNIESNKISHAELFGQIPIKN